MAAIEETFNKELPLATLFRVTTIEQLASLLRHEEASAPVATTEQQFALPGEVSSTVSCSQDFPQLTPEDYRALLSLVAGRKGERP